MIFREFINSANGALANSGRCAVLLAGLSIIAPGVCAAQNANPWNPNNGQNTQPDAGYAQQAPAPNQIWSADRPPADLYAPADLGQRLSSGGARAVVVAPNAAVATQPEPGRYASDDPTITTVPNVYPAPLQQGFGYPVAPQAYTVAPQGYGYSQAPQGFGYGAVPQGFGLNGVPQQGYGYGLPAQGNGFYPGYNPGQPYGNGGYPNNFGGFVPSGGSYPGGNNSNFFGFTPFGFF